MSEAPLPSKLNDLAKVSLEILRLKTKIKTLKTYLQNSNRYILLLQQYLKIQH